MSEYQYYEFAAIERPLTRTEMAELRAVSTRAAISPAGFVNHYEWGNLKADPADWMQRYFDAFVYTANWCSCELTLRIPLASFRKAELKPYASKHSLTIEASAKHWIFHWYLEDSQNYDRFGEDDGRGWMQRLAPLRDELLAGDLRPLYLGWLAGAASMSKSVREPEVPPDLANLTAAQQALVEFLEIDADLLAAASTGSTAPSCDGENRNLTTWLETWSKTEANAVLKQIVTGQARHAEHQVRSHYARWLKAQRSPAAPTRVRRTLAALHELAEPIAATRQQREIEERKKHEAEQRRKREVHLHEMMAKVKTHWKTADAEARNGTASSYEQVVRILTDLAAGYALTGKRVTFKHDLQHFLAPHASRRALQQRLVKAGLLKE